AALGPEAAAAAGIALARLLWVRPRSVSDAFRAAEILLGAGGFGLVVLDVDAPRAGAGGWPRLARAAERTGSVLLVVAPSREAGTFAALGLELGARRVRWSGGPGRLVLLEGIDARVTVARSRVGRPGQALVVRQACACDETMPRLACPLLPDPPVAAARRPDPDLDAPPLAPGAG